MDIYAILRKDHEKLMSLFDQLEACGPDEERRRERIFHALYAELAIHADAEDRFFLGRLKRLDAMRDLALGSLEAHKRAKRMLAELDALDKGSPAWPAKCLELRDSVERYIETQERELFPLARLTVGEEEAEGMAEDIEAFKEEMLELEAY